MVCALTSCEVWQHSVEECRHDEQMKSGLQMRPLTLTLKTFIVQLSTGAKRTNDFYWVRGAPGHVPGHVYYDIVGNRAILSTFRAANCNRAKSAQNPIDLTWGNFKRTCHVQTIFERAVTGAKRWATGQRTCHENFAKIGRRV